MKSRKYKPIFGEKHLQYIRACRRNTYNIAEGAIRAGKTVDNVFAFCTELEYCPDKIHLASASTLPTAKLVIGDCNGMGIEAQYRGRCSWGKYKDNDCLKVRTKTGLKIVIFTGGGKADSFKKIRGSSYGMWIATEINLHHADFIVEAFNRTAAAKMQKYFWDLNPDNPKAEIYTKYIDLYREKDAAGEFPGGCNYGHFTLSDNATMSEERKEAFKARYDPNSIWYKRDILGLRCAAEGAIYPLFSNDPERFIIDKPPDDIAYCIIGVDFGGTISASTFCLTGISRDFQRVYTLDEYYMHETITPDQLEQDFIAFVKKAQQQYRVYEAFMDNAEQTLIAGMRSAAMHAGIPIDVLDAQKRPINDRIRFYNRLMGTGHYFIMRHCENTIDALRTAIFDPKKPNDERLDDGIMNIDSLDAMEYSTESIMDDIIIMG